MKKLISFIMVAILTMSIGFATTYKADSLVPSQDYTINGGSSYAINFVNAGKGMTVASNGKVGVGTTTPDSRLTVTGGTNSASDWFSIFNNVGNETHKLYVDGNAGGVIDVLNNANDDVIRISHAAADGGRIVIGRTGVTEGANPGVILQREVDSTGNGHGFQDYTWVNLSEGYAYASYDVRNKIYSADDLDHYIGLQFAPEFRNTGNIDVIRGIRSIPQQHSGSIDRFDHISVRDVAQTGGTITNQYGYAITDELDSGTNNWAMHINTTAPSYFKGNIGIGGEAPDSKLTIYDTTTSASDDFSMYNSIDTETFRVFHDGQNNPYLAMSNSTGTTKIVLDGDGVSYFNGGNVGIGINNPSEKLSVNGVLGIRSDNVIGSGNGYSGDSSSANNADLQLWSTSGETILKNNWGSGKLKLRVGVSEAITIVAGGNVGIGNITPSAKLDINEDTGFGDVRVDGSSGACLMLRDTDDAGWTKCTTLDGVMSCSIDADGVC